MLLKIQVNSPYRYRAHIYIIIYICMYVCVCVCTHKHKHAHASLNSCVTMGFSVQDPFGSKSESQESRGPPGVCATHRCSHWVVGAPCCFLPPSCHSSLQSCHICVSLEFRVLTPPQEYLRGGKGVICVFFLRYLCLFLRYLCLFFSF